MLFFSSSLVAFPNHDYSFDIFRLRSGIELKKKVLSSLSFAKAEVPRPFCSKVRLSSVDILYGFVQSPAYLNTHIFQ